MLARLARGRVWVSDEPPYTDGLDNPLSGNVTSDVSGDGEAIFKSVALVAVAVADPVAVAQVVADYVLASACLGLGRDFFKSDHGPIPSGARWIIVHPNGEGTKGTPVLVEPVKDGSGHFRVIAGAGGKLNMPKLRGLKSGEDLKTKVGERAAAKRARLKEQVRKDKELGLHDAKTAARKDLNEQRRKAERSFIETVANAMGWDAESLHPPAGGFSLLHKKRRRPDCAAIC